MKQTAPKFLPLQKSLNRIGQIASGKKPSISEVEKRLPLQFEAYVMGCGTGQNGSKWEPNLWASKKILLGSLNKKESNGEAENRLE